MARWPEQAGSFGYFEHSRIDSLAVRAYHDVEIAGLKDAVAIRIIIGEGCGIDVEVDSLALSFSEVDATEAFKFFYRSDDVRITVVDIKFDDFIAISVPCVSDGGRCCYLATFFIVDAESVTGLYL